MMSFHYKSRVVDTVNQHPLAAIIFGGLVFRLVLFDIAPVNIDAGFFLYDASLILEGQIPIIDYDSRSPLYHLLLAPLLALDISPLVAGRLYMIFVSCVLGAALFQLTAELHCKNAGYWSAAVFLFTPFSAIVGQSLKTQLVAELGVVIGLLAIVSHLNDSDMGWIYLSSAGVAFGAVFFIRRVVLAHLAAVGLFLLVYRLKNTEDTVIQSVFRGAVFGTSMIVTVLLGFVILAGPSRGFRLVGELVIPLFTSDSGISASAGSASSLSLTGVFLMFCSKCGSWTISNLSESILITLPALLPLFVLAKSFVAHFGRPRLTSAGLTVVAIGISIWGLYLGLLNRQVWTPLVGVALLASLSALVLVWRMETPEFSELWTPELTLIPTVIVILFAAYLQRNRIFTHLYVLDLFPFIAVLSGVSIAETMDSRHLNRDHLSVAIGILVVSFVVALITAPVVGAFGAVDKPYDPGVGTVTGIQTAGADLESRSNPGEEIFTVQPLYPLEADRHNYNDLSRAYWVMLREPESDLAVSWKTRILSGLRDGDVQYVIIERRMENLFRVHPELSGAIERNFCPVTTDTGVYNRLNARLYSYSEDAPGCG
jgi:hypothetical protein